MIVLDPAFVESAAARFKSFAIKWTERHKTIYRESAEEAQLVRVGVKYALDSV